jgi:hypothetical protein
MNENAILEYQLSYSLSISNFKKLSMVLKIIAIKDFKEAKLPSLDKALQVQSRIRKLFLFQPLNLMKLYISLKIYISFYVH